MPRSQPIPLPKGWPKVVRSGVLHAISIGATAMTAAWARAMKARSKRRLQADIDRLRAEVTHLEEELAIKDSRWGRHSPRRRPHYGPVQRMRILRLQALGLTFMGSPSRRPQTSLLQNAHSPTPSGFDRLFEL